MKPRSVAVGVVAATSGDAVLQVRMSGYVAAPQTNSSELLLPMPKTVQFQLLFFFFQAEDGIRDWSVTGVQTCALPIFVRAAPGYDPWTWLLWGREVASGTLSTADGPAFKPLPVAVCALLAPLGSAAPVVWVVLVRAAAGAALVLAYRLARDLDQPRRGQTPSRVGRGLLAGGLAVVGVAL